MPVQIAEIPNKKTPAPYIEAPLYMAEFNCKQAYDEYASQGYGHRPVFYIAEAYKNLNEFLRRCEEKGQYDPILDEWREYYFQLTRKLENMIINHAQEDLAALSTTHSTYQATAAAQRRSESPQILAGGNAQVVDYDIPMPATNTSDEAEYLSNLRFYEVPDSVPSSPSVAQSEADYRGFPDYISETPSQSSSVYSERPVAELPPGFFKSRSPSITSTASVRVEEGPEVDPRQVFNPYPTPARSESRASTPEIARREIPQPQSRESSPVEAPRPRVNIPIPTTSPPRDLQVRQYARPQNTGNIDPARLNEIRRAEQILRDKKQQQQSQQLQDPARLRAEARIKAAAESRRVAQQRRQQQPPGRPNQPSGPDQPRGGRRG